MKYGYCAIGWGEIVAQPGGVTSISELYYQSSGNITDVLKNISGAGFKGIEIFDGNVKPYFNDPQKFKDLLQEYDLEFCAAYSGANLIFPDIQKEELSKIEKVARFVLAAGGKRIDIGAGAIRSTGIRKDDWRLLAKGLDEIVNICENVGVPCCYHPHLGTITETPDQINKVLEATKMDFCPDCAHLAAAGVNVVKIVKTFASKISYVHLKDWDGKKFVELGKGKVNLIGFMQALRSIGYDDWFTVELDPPCKNPTESAKFNMRYIRENLSFRESK